jgi:hypothetical protein
MKDLNKRFPVYSKFLKLYPVAYRKRYEQEMLQTTADMLDDAPSRSTKIAIWSKLAIDLPVNVSKQQLQYAGGIMHNSIPNYVKRNSLISAALLLPFFGAIAANGIDKLINNSNLYHSWLWHNPTIMLWVFYLPILAFLISFVSYSLLIFKGTNKSKVWFKRAIDNTLHSWPMLTVGIVAFGILTMVEFHDSTQCVLRSPVHAASNASQTLHCIEANRTIIPRHDLQLGQ